MIEFETTESDRMLCGLSYPFWLAMAWFLLFSSKPLLKFHAVQSLGVGLLTTIVQAILWFMFYRLSRPSADVEIAYGLVMVGWFCGLLFLGLAIFTVVMVFAWKAWQGQTFQIPLLGPLAEKYANA